MSFTWQQSEKEKYFKKAEDIIKAAGFDDILVVDRGSFGITGDTEVKIFLQSFHRTGNTRRWWEAKREIKNLHEQTGGKNRFGKKEKTILIHGYIVMEMEETEE